MASGGEGAPTRDSIATRASTGKGKSVDYRQLLRGKHDGMDGSGEEEATGAGSGSVFYDGQSSGTGFYNQRPEMEGKSPLRDFDFYLKDEEEELDGLPRQLEAARKEEALLRRRSAADELRHQIAAQQESNARLRGMTKSDIFQSESMRHLSHSQDKDKTLGDEQINIDTLR